MKKQLGQSMTEYLVVLGVTGAGLLAATTDVTTLFTNVQDSYSTQSTEMNKVQIYSNPKFQPNPITRDEGDGDDGDDTPDVPVNNPVAEYPPVALDVVDASGNHLGTLNENDILVDQNGNEIAWCQRQNTGQCKFVDENGNEVFPGATTNSEWVDDEGNPLQLHALSRNGAVVGFAYFYNGNYHDAVTRKRLDIQTNLQGVATRQVTSLDEDGKPFTSGREANGYIYSEASVQSGDTQNFSTAKTIEAELVTVRIEDPSGTDLSKYKPCAVVPTNWSTGIDPDPDTGIATVPNPLGIADKQFLEPTSWINTPVENCNGRNSVTLKENGDWVMN